MKTMNNNEVNKMIKIFYGISSAMVLIGAFFKLQHYPNGNLILIIGFIIGSATSFYDTFRHKKKIKSLEEKLKQNK